MFIIPPPPSRSGSSKVNESDKINSIAERLRDVEASAVTHSEVFRVVMDEVGKLYHILENLILVENPPPFGEGDKVVFVKDNKVFRGCVYSVTLKEFKDASIHKGYTNLYTIMVEVSGKLFEVDFDELELYEND